MTEIIPTSPRTDVQARFPEGQALNGPMGTTIEAFVKAANWQDPGVVVAALLNGRLRELSCRMYHDADIVPITTADSDGVRIYRRSLSFLLIAAAAQLFPERTIANRDANEMTSSHWPRQNWSSFTSVCAIWLRTIYPFRR